MVFSNLGIYHDLICILTKYFNGDSKIQWVDMSNVPESIKAFFYKKDNAGSFMQHILNECCEELLRGGGIEIIQSKIIDDDKVLKNMIEFYFDKNEFEYAFDDPRFLKNINSEIVKSKYPAEIKSSFYALFIDPCKTINALMRTFLELNLQVAKIYENYRFSISKVQSEINDTELLRKLSVPNLTTENTVCAICLMDDEYIDIIPVKNKFLLLLGCNYDKNFPPYNEIRIKEFGNVLTDENRLKILDMMRLKGEITIKDVEQQFGFSGTTAYYHLSHMVKANIVSTRSEGRIIIYSINKDYLKKICFKIAQYYM